MLSGTLLRPTAADPARANFPGVVFVHGSGPHTREGPISYADAFLNAGVGVLAFDKRGTGQSTGSWTSASLDDLAGDIVAAVDFLRDQAGFDPQRIGLWGVSQGAWIAPMVVANDPDIAFLIMVSGGAVSPLQSELFSYERAFERADLPSKSRAEARALLGRYFAYLSTGADFEGLMNEVERVKELPWYSTLNIHRIIPQSEAGRSKWQWVANWNPLPSIMQVRCPTLLIFGDQDNQQPTEQAVMLWRQGLELAGNSAYEIRVFEGANHGIRMPAPGQSGHHGRGPFADGYLDTITSWLRELD